jgi:hypothetical protein
MKPSETEARWRRLIAEQRRSGQSVREFAEEKGVSAWSLYGWRSRLGIVRCPKGRERKAARCREVAAEAELVPVDVVGGEPDGVVGSQPLLEVEIGDVRVRVPRGFDAEELGRLVSVLRASC